MDDVVGNTDENVREVIHFIRKGLGGTCSLWKGETSCGCSIGGVKCEVDRVG